MSDQMKFSIGGKLYPLPEATMFGDATLVFSVTGLEFEDWGQRMDAMREAAERGSPANDVRAMIGLVAVAVARAEPDWTEAQVVKFVKNIDANQFAVQEPEEDETDGPPANPPETAEASTTSSDESTTSPVIPVEGAPV